MGLVERQAEMQGLEDSPRPGRSRDLFGVQLEVSDRASTAIPRITTVCGSRLHCAVGTVQFVRDAETLLILKLIFFDKLFAP